MTIAKLPLAKGVADFEFAGTPIYEALVRDLATGTFLANQRIVVLVGGTGSGKKRLSIAIASSCIRADARVRFHNTTDLVNRLEMEVLQGRAGKLAEDLSRFDFLILDARRSDRRRWNTNRPIKEVSYGNLDLSPGVD